MKTFGEQDSATILAFWGLVLLVGLILSGCGSGAPDADLADVAEGDGCSQNVDFSSPYPPPQPPVGANNSTDCVYDIFAWQSLAALQWPAINPDSSNNFKRGFADASQSFTSQNDPDLPVWETWKAKREVFTGVCGDNRNWPGATSQCGSSAESQLPQQAPMGWNSQIDYGPVLSSGTFTVCADASNPAAVEAALKDPFHQNFSMASKINSEGLDEDLEVKGEGYYPNTAVINGQTVQVRGSAVEPQVFKSSSGNPVVYEVKMNYDWFNYVVTQNQFFNTATKQSAASAGTISFPGRTASYSPANCTAGSEFPCSMGAIETKSGWALADGEDTSRYHTTQALYFKADSSSASATCADLGTFLLTGFHINQKTDNQPYFIYATFGHVDNAKGNNEFRYQNKIDDALVPVSSNDPAAGAGYGVGYITSTQESADGGPVYATTPLARIPSWTQQLNQVVQSQIQAANASSVWQYYQLVGTQFLPVNSDNTSGDFPIGSNNPGNVGEAFYLANLTLETNWGLQNFQGEPPGITPISSFSSIIPSNCQGSATYNRACPNTIFNGTGYIMGGCMGCHGVAQQLGYDFSFVLLRSGGTIELTPPPRTTP